MPQEHRQDRAQEQEAPCPNHVENPRKAFTLALAVCASTFTRSSFPRGALTVAKFWVAISSFRQAAEFPSRSEEKRCGRRQTVTCSGNGYLVHFSARMNATLRKVNTSVFCQSPLHYTIYDALAIGKPFRGPMICRPRLPAGFSLFIFQPLSYRLYVPADVVNAGGDEKQTDEYYPEIQS
ncbi:MAG TPA: hypothetical protein VHX37_15765 [Acidobacteriaceae bacterium]|nr:hypothetical protein [Acidobacteriaceae bacterium]